MRIEVPEPVVVKSSDDVRTFCYRRNFNLPTGLESSTRVYLHIGGWEGRLEKITLNEVTLPIGNATNVDAEITQLLKSHNEIELCLADANGQVARLSGEVALAIEEAGD